jgi:hypothetical protein
VIRSQHTRRTLPGRGDAADVDLVLQLAEVVLTEKNAIGGANETEADE